MNDLGFQFGAFIVLLGVLTALTGTFAIPVSQLCLYYLGTRKSKRKRLVIAGLLTPFMVFLAATGIMAITAGHFFGGVFYLMFPIAFLTTSSALGVGIEWLVVKSEES
jgi:hypothetical protein